MAGRKGDYLFKQPASKNWYIAFEYPPELRAEFGKKKVRSLGTPDRAEAEKLAEPLVAEHKARIAAADEMRAKADLRTRSVPIGFRTAADLARTNEIAQWIYERQGTVGDVQVMELATLTILFSDPDIAFEFKMRFG
ncbi:DUF6538 domain-containing protein [Methylobacterium sp. Leaf85]|uniref:DUF6538 domain-containing protein n=1 Tax=Methylobacterium sp. Leaf85 TaxID=1736241 RepID=UPI0006FC80D5|nr:DUF6538 domain-containing protein [Methylobacterium sp. Leaf85]KQO43006.1 hypothetical protein ASF08_10535 [Methylobacterium sp. Leaf85]